MTLPHRKSIRRNRLLAVVAGATLAVSAAPAHADREVVKDSRRDVTSLSLDTFPEEPAAAPDNSSADITRSVVDHRARVLVVRVKVRDTRAAEPTMGLALITTPRGSYEVFFGKEPGAKSGPIVDIGVGGEPVRCRAARARVSLVDDVLQALIPRRCLGTPRWMRVRLATLGESADGESILLDDARRAGMRRDLVLSAGPRLRRG